MLRHPVHTVGWFRMVIRCKLKLLRFVVRQSIKTTGVMVWDSHSKLMTFRENRKQYKNVPILIILDVNFFMVASTFMCDETNRLNVKIYNFALVQLGKLYHQNSLINNQWMPAALGDASAAVSTLKTPTLRYTCYRQAAFNGNWRPKWKNFLQIIG